MGKSAALKKSAKPSKPGYILDEQIGFILRQVWQRHASIFARDIGINLTPTQWAALAKLAETGPCSQNQLGRRLLVSLTRAGAQTAEKAAANALAISKETLAPLEPKERETLFALLNKL